MKFNLLYGKTGLVIDLPGRLNIDLIEPRWTNAVDNQYDAVSAALQEPHNSKPIKELAGKNDRIGIIFSDITRATPYNIMIPPLLNELSHIPKKNIRFFCSNGTHRLATVEELISILGKEIVNTYEIIQNNSNDEAFHQFVGTTASGNRILLNKEILNCNLKILTGFIEPHFFAGFSGGGKALIPGMAAVSTIKKNHSVNYLSNENSTWGVTYGNPLWEEIMEAAEFVPGLFLLNVTLNRNREITAVFAGDLRTAHIDGCRYAKETAMVPVDRLYDIVITSNSGYPLDLNIYQTVKGMSAASQVVKPGGTIILAAECWDGIPSGSDYEAILESVNGSDELMDYVITNEGSLKDTWQIYYQAIIQKKAHVHLYSRTLDHSTIRKALFTPAADIESLVISIADKIGKEAAICIMPEGPLTIPYLDRS